MCPLMFKIGKFALCYTSQVEAAVIVLRKVSTTKETTKDSLPKRDSGGKGGRQEAD